MAGRAIVTPRAKCQICGKKMLRITATHLDTHNVTVEAYKKQYGENSLKPDMSRVNRDRLYGGPGNSKLTDELQRKIAEKVRAGNRLTTAAQACGIGATTAWNWFNWGAEVDEEGHLLKDPIYYGFRTAILQAEAEAEIESVQQVKDAGKADWKAAMAFLERRFSAGWKVENKIRVESEHKTEVVHELDVRKVLADPDAADAAASMLSLLANMGLRITAEPQGLPIPEADYEVVEEDKIGNDNAG
jgi:hypothetical protein